MPERVQCLLLVQSPKQPGVKSLRSSSSASENTLALLPQTFKDVYPQVFEFLSFNSIRVVDESFEKCKSNYTPLQNSKFEIFEIELSSFYTKSHSTDFLLHVKDRDKELGRLLFSRSIDNIRPFKRESESFICSAIDKKNLQFIDCCLKDGAEFGYRHSSGGTFLHFAAESGHKALIKVILNYGAEIDARRSDGMTPLHLAAKNGHFQGAKTLLQVGANIHAETAGMASRGRTPLLLATEKGHAKVVKLLIDAGADLNAVSHVDHENEFTEPKLAGPAPLLLAAEKGHAEIVELLLKNGADVNEKSTTVHTSCRTPMMLASQLGHYDVAKLLLECGAVLNGVHCSDGSNNIQAYCTPLLKAVQSMRLVESASNENDAASKGSLGRGSSSANVEEHIEVIKLLLESGADTTAIHYDEGEESNVLCEAVHVQNVDLIKLLLSHRPDVNDKCCKKAYYFAWCEYSPKSKEILWLMRRCGFSLDENLEKYNKLELFFGAIHKNNFSLVLKLIENGIDVNQMYKPSRFFQPKETTPLHLAAGFAEEDIFKLLLDHGAAVDAVDTYGNTPLFIAVQVDDVEVIKLLLNHGANVDAVDKGGVTSLFYAIADKSVNVVKVLLENGANIHEDPHLFVAIYYFHKDILELLFLHGADPNAQDEDDNRLVIAVLRRGTVETLNTFLKFGATVKHDSSDCSLLYLAASLGRTDFFELILDHNFHDIDVFWDTRFVNDIHLLSEIMNLIRAEGPRPSFREYAFLLRCHTVKMMSAGLSVCKEKLLQLSFYRLSSVKEFKKSCQEEVAMMQETKIGKTDVTYHDILKTDTNRIACYARSDCFVLALKSEEYEEKFPIYSRILKCHTEKGCLRRDLLTLGMKNCGGLFTKFSQLPDDLQEKIASHLSNRDLQILNSISHFFSEK